MTTLPAPPPPSLLTSQPPPPTQHLPPPPLFLNYPFLAHQPHWQPQPLPQPLIGLTHFTQHHSSQSSTSRRLYLKLVYLFPNPPHNNIPAAFTVTPPVTNIPPPLDKTMISSGLRHSFVLM